MSNTVLLSIGGAIFFVIAVILVVIYRWTKAESLAHEELRQRREFVQNRGIQATAKIVESEYIMVDPEGRGRSAFVMVLEVNSPDGSVYKVDEDRLSRVPGFMTIGDPYSHLLTKVGAMVPVRIDPDDKMKVILDEELIEKESELDRAADE